MEPNPNLNELRNLSTKLGEANQGLTPLTRNRVYLDEQKNLCFGRYITLKASDAQAALDVLHLKIQGIVHRELAAIAEIYQPDLLIAREQEFQEILKNLKENLDQYYRLHVYRPEEREWGNSEWTDSLLTLGKILNPAEGGSIDGDKIAEALSQFRTKPNSKDQLKTIDQLAARILLNREVKTLSKYNLAPCDLKQLIEGCEAAFKADAQWPVGSPQGLYEIRLAIQNNLLIFPDQLPPPSAFMALRKMHIRLNREFSRPADLRILFEILDSAYSNYIKELGRSCSLIFEKNDVKLFAHILTQYKNIPPTLYSSEEQRFDKSLRQGVLQFADIDTTQLDEKVLKVLDHIGTGPRLSLEMLSPETRTAIANFHNSVWPANRRKGYAPGVSPDISLKLADGSEIPVHAAVIARGIGGMLMPYRDPSFTGELPKVLDLSHFEKTSVQHLLRFLYGLPLPDSCTLDPKLIVYLYGIHENEIETTFSPPIGKDACSDLDVLCKNNEVLHCHRVILAHKFGEIASKNLDWTDVNVDDAQMLLNFLYTDKFNLDETEQLIEVSQRLKLVQVETIFLKKLNQEVQSLLEADPDNDFDPKAFLVKAERLISILRSLGQKDLMNQAESHLNRVKEVWLEFLSDDELFQPRDIRTQWKKIRIAEVLKEPIRENEAREEMIDLLLHMSPKRMNPLPNWVGQKVIYLGKRDLTMDQQANLSLHMVKSPSLELDLNATNVGEYFITECMKNGFPLGRLRVEICKNISPAVYQLMRKEVPTPGSFQEVTPFMIQLACHGSLELQASILSSLIHEDWKELDLSPFTIDLKTLIDALQGIPSVGRRIILQKETATDEWMSKLSKIGFETVLK